MNKEKFESMLILIVPQVIRLILENYKWDEITAADNFYSSKVYSELEKEDTKLWHFSPLTIYNMFEEEEKTGSFVFPEEV